MVNNIVTRHSAATIFFNAVELQAHDFLPCTTYMDMRRFTRFGQRPVVQKDNAIAIHCMQML